MQTIKCVIERVTYQNLDDGYSVLKAHVSGYSDLVPIIGNMPDVSAGCVLEVTGEWKNDPKYGEEFIVSSWIETMPATLYGIEKYLGSGLIKGVGPVYAKRIVSKFGTDTIDVIENTPEKLTEVPGIGARKVKKIQESWEKQREVKNIVMFLQEHGANTRHAAWIYKEYGNESIRTIRENPYKLADDVWGIGFRTADGIAEKLGFDKESFARCRSGLMYTLNQLADSGHVYAERDQLIDKAVELLDIDHTFLSFSIDHMLKEEDLIQDEDAVYLPPFYQAEKNAANRLLALAQAPGRISVSSPPDIKAIEKAAGVVYDEIQAEGICEAARSKVCVLTGGPGTGKTTTTLGIIKALKSYGMKIILAAPTGRAAKRMTETTGMEAKTVHRLLEFSPKDGYQRNEKNPLDGDVLIVDECSMLDIILTNTLLKAIPSHRRLILVGDIDQLPSVGAGNVLRDIIDSEVFPVVRLTKIFRQAQTSRIIMNAHRINRGEMPDISNGKNTDFFFLPVETPEEIAGCIESLVKTRPKVS
ncbi:MAG: AAA family ATPase [Lachnospiraceae bacterium]|nr:AAA family ATPase [Lachnospiraceae bacterium]